MANNFTGRQIATVVANIVSRELLNAQNSHNNGDFICLGRAVFSSVPSHIGNGR